MPTGTLFFVLRDGSTREEQWTWEEIEALCRSGDVTPDARIFLPDEERWARVSETRLAGIARAPARSGAAADDDSAVDDRQALEEEYRTAVARAAEETDSLEALLDAGILAAQTGRRDEAREHFQTVLHRHPYHARAAQEIKRRFSRTEQKVFRYLERPSAAWEDIGELVTMPFARGPLYIAVPAALLAPWMWVPYGGAVLATVLFLWMFQVMEYTARGANRPPEWNRSFKDPVKKLLRPAALIGCVVAMWGGVLFGLTKLAMVLERTAADVSMLGYMSHSPVVAVAVALVAALYLPAAMVSIGGFTGSVAGTLDPRRIARMVIRMEHEYVYTVLLLVGTGVVVSVVRMATAWVPLLGNLVFAVALAWAAPVVGITLGRLLGRMGHAIE